MNQSHFEDLGGGKCAIFGGGLFGGGHSGTNLSKLPSHQDTARFSTKPVAGNLAKLRTTAPKKFQEQLAAIRKEGAAKLTATFSKNP